MIFFSLTFSQTTKQYLQESHERIKQIGKLMKLPALQILI
jgi:hypothetical protein